MAAAGGKVELLNGVDDAYGGVIVEMKDPMDADAFVRSLRASIAKWRQQGVRGVWMKLPIELASLIQPAVQEGFWYHHAEPSYLMLVYWIPETAHTFPINASHRVGVGAFVINDKKEVLVVQEKTGKAAGMGLWKFPTGVVDQIYLLEQLGKSRKRQELTLNLLKSLHSGKVICLSSESQICSLCACCVLFHLIFRSKNQKLRQLSGCQLMSMQHNLSSRSMIF